MNQALNTSSDKFGLHMFVRSAPMLLKRIVFSVMYEWPAALSNKVAERSECLLFGYYSIIKNNNKALT